MTRCYWCPNCGWVETTDLFVYVCEKVCARGMRHDFGFHPSKPEWRTDYADLAMALDLSELLFADALQSHDYLIDYDQLDVSDWVYTEVRNALLERAQ